MTVAVITPPPALASLALVKKHLRVESDDYNELITAYVAAASGHIDGVGAYLGRAIGQQVLEVRQAQFPAAAFALPFVYSPVRAVVSVKYRAASGVEVTMPEGDYQLEDTVLAPVAPLTWPATDCSAGAVKVRYQAGYEEVPAAIVAAVLLMVGDLWANRENVVVGSIAGAIPMPAASENLLRPYRVLEV